MTGRRAKRTNIWASMEVRMNFAVLSVQGQSKVIWCISGVSDLVLKT